jgi:hypothetical protein
MPMKHRYEVPREAKLGDIVLLWTGPDEGLVTGCGHPQTAATARRLP